MYSEKNKKHYIGYTSDAEKRLSHHNAGENKSTKSGVPWKIIREECFSTKKEAWLRERQIKRYKGGEAFKKLMSEGSPRHDGGPR
jgi:putative endonuclease